MMSQGIRIRLLAFAVLSAVGIVYVAANYLGFVDRVLGRGITVQATLPTSGGLFEGSAVTYRGVKVGKVSQMRTSVEGVELTLSLEHDTRLPVDSPMFVHNLTAVGEQYLDFEPPDDEPPYAENGDVLRGSADSLPTDEADLLIELNDFVQSVDEGNLQVVVKELGDMFEETGEPLERLLDNSSRFIEEANANAEETIALLEDGLVVLDTQQDNADNITSFARDLRLLTGALADSDRDLRRTLQGTPGTAREVEALLLDLEPTLPVLLGNAISINQVMISHLNGLEQLLVTFPRTIAGGFTGTTPDGFGHVNLQYDSDVPPCTEGYKPVSQWRQGNELSDAPIFPAKCESGRPFVARGFKYSPGQPLNPNPARSSVSSAYDPVTGLVDGVTDAEGDPVRYLDQGNLSVLGSDAWKWLLVGPVTSR
jgi:phospholipid/cholesterol/gamma-HCH transport system substrate-binding protein